jgi:hypothetical protein
LTDAHYHKCPSFVALTYQANNNDTENIFYSEEKQQIYLTQKIGELVISAHFKLSEAWSERRVKRQHVPILKKDNLNLDCPFQFRILQKLLWFVINAYAKQNYSHTRNDYDEVKDAA